VRIGVDLPYFADPAEIRRFAVGVEELGFCHVGMSEHVVATRDSAFPDGFSFDDPWHESFTQLAFVAGITSRIELNSAMTLLTLRPAALAAKQAAEVDLLSGGRLRLAVSVGWNARENEALGVEPSIRGSLLEEQVTVLRRLWTEESVTYEGRHLRLSEVGMHPHPLQRPIPIWMGAGHVDRGGVPTGRALGRIARHADGFKALGQLSADTETGSRVVARLRELVVAEGRDPATFGIEGRIPRHASEADWPRVIAAWAKLGATHLGFGIRIAGGDAAAHLDRARRFVELTREHW
jgi:probable F420-dependent oxidoreductase